MGKSLRDIGRELEEERANRPPVRLETELVSHDPETDTSVVHIAIKGRNVD